MRRGGTGVLTSYRVFGSIFYRMGLEIQHGTPRNLGKFGVSGDD